MTFILIAALMAHISVNTFNEYYDFKSGLDLNTVRTAFSGGSGALPERPELAPLTLLVAQTSLVITIAIGLYLMVYRIGAILPLGIIGTILILTYTQWLNRSAVACLVAPGLGFGVLMVVGTHTLLAGQLDTLPWLVAPIAFFLMNNLLLLNQYPDITADRNAGRSTAPIAFGINISNTIYAIFFICAYSLVVIETALGYIPTVSLFALLPAPLAIYALIGAVRYRESIGKHPRFLAANVGAAILTPLLLAITLLLAT